VNRDKDGNRKNTRKIMKTIISKYTFFTLYYSPLDNYQKSRNNLEVKIEHEAVQKKGCFDILVKHIMNQDPKDWEYLYSQK